MNLTELHSFKLSDAIKFHKELNPKLWKNDQLDPLVKKQLLVIAEDFVEELGIADLDVVDITISGSNAAFTYTKHSDLDLHILVNMSELHQDAVYRELFRAKKTLYNDTHDITVHGIPVELYVQDSAEPVVSLGEYSILHDKWIKIPKRRSANLDQNATKAKFEQLKDLIDVALKTKHSKKINKALALIRRYRQAGLDKGGEFSPENLAYKAVRSQGAMDALYAMRDKLHSAELTIEEGIRPAKVHKPDPLAEKLSKEFEDFDPNGKPPGPEFKPTMPAGTVKVDVSDVYDWYKLGQHVSNLKGLGKHDFGKGPPSTILSFGDEETEHRYIKDLEKTGLTTTDIDPLDRNQPKDMPRQSTDPTYNVDSYTDDLDEALDSEVDHIATAINKFAQNVGVFAELRQLPEAEYPAIELTDLYAERLGAGDGSKVMIELARMADEAGINVFVHPAQARNNEFYARFGFEKDRRYRGMMVRYPSQESEDLAEDFEWQDDPRCWHGDDKDTTPYQGLLKKRVKMSLPEVYPEGHKYFIQVFYKNSPTTAVLVYTRNSSDVGRMQREIDFDAHARGEVPETFWWGDMTLTAEEAFNLHQCQRRGLKKAPKKQNITWTPVDEALDSQPYPYEEIPAEYKSQKLFRFKTDKDLTYLVSLHDFQGRLGISFALQKSKFRLSTEIEDTGDARKVFATVIEIVKKYVNATKPVKINFTADEPSRMRLYDAFIKRLDRELPDYLGSQDQGYYVLNRKSEKLDESKNDTISYADAEKLFHKHITASHDAYDRKDQAADTAHGDFAEELATQLLRHSTAPTIQVKSVLSRSARLFDKYPAPTKWEPLDEDYEWQDDPMQWHGDDKNTAPYNNFLKTPVKMSVTTGIRYFIKEFNKTSPTTATIRMSRSKTGGWYAVRDIDFDALAAGHAPETFWVGNEYLTPEEAFNLFQLQKHKTRPKKEPKQKVIWEPLDEALDSQPYPYEQVEDSRIQAKYTFNTDKGLTYFVGIGRGGDEKNIHVSFWLYQPERRGLDRMNMEIANTGDARKVFATVIDIVKKYVNEHNPNRIIFTASENSRIRLYDAFVKRLDRELPSYIATPKVQGMGAWFVLERKPAEDLDEALDSQPYPYEQIPPTHRDYTDSRNQYVFTTNDNLSYRVTLFNYPGNRSRIEFKSKKQTHDFPEFGVTGSGDARKVFATVIEIVKKHVGEHHPVDITFSAKEPSRVRLYNAFMKRLDRELPDYEGKSGPGYEADNTYYYLTLKKPPLDESTDRDSAIQKIKKLQNTQGRSPSEIEASKMLIAKIMKRYDIHPKELRPVDRNPYQNRINQARAERDVAGDMLKAEWDRFKGGIKDKVSSVFKENVDVEDPDETMNWWEDYRQWHPGELSYDDLVYMTSGTSGKGLSPLMTPLKVKIDEWEGQPQPKGTYDIKEFRILSLGVAKLVIVDNEQELTTGIVLDGPATHLDRNNNRRENLVFYHGKYIVPAAEAFNIFQLQQHTKSPKSPVSKIPQIATKWEPLDEALDSQPYPYEIEEDSITWQISTFTTSDRNRYKVFISKSRNKEVDLEFEWVGNDDKDVEAGLGIYNLGDSRKVFATIIKIVQDYVKKYKPNMISFTAEEPSRKRLYSALVNRVDRALPDYEDQSADFLGDFHLVRKGYGVNEGTSEDGWYALTRKTEKLDEALDSQPYPYEIEEDSGRWQISTFKTNDDNKYKVWISKFSNKEANVEFSYIGDDDVDDITSTDIRHTGDARKVFATVIEIVKKYANKYKPNMITFSSDPDEPSRMRLYGAFVKRADRVMPDYRDASNEIEGSRTHEYVLIRKGFQFNEASGYIPSKKENMEEIGFANALGAPSTSDEQIINNSTKDGTIGSRPVFVYTTGPNSIYFFANESTIDALVYLHDGYLKGMKNFSKNKGLIYNLFQYLINLKGQQIKLSPTDTLTPDGIQWILTQIKRKEAGFKIMDQDGNKIDPNTLYDEWESARITGKPGPTAITLGESRNSNWLKENEQSLMPMDTYGATLTEVVPHKHSVVEVPDLIEASGYIPSKKEANDPRFKTALTVDVKPDSIQKNAGDTESLTNEFLQSIYPEEKRYYTVRDNCGPAAIHMQTWLKKNKGIDTTRIRGYFIADDVVYDKKDFTPDMKQSFFKSGLNWNNGKDRYDFIKNNPEYSEWNEIPHFWLEDSTGKIYDPSGQMQFIDTGLTSDMSATRYKKEHITEASGYIPSKKEANDPRFSTALTVDVKPDSIQKNAKAFGSKTSRAGIPPTARADGKI